MKKSFIITLLIVLIASSCSKEENYTGSNNIISQERDVSVFNKISSEGVFEVNIIQGPVQSIVVNANDNIINRLKTTVSDNKLSIYLLEGDYSNLSIVVNITVADLNEIQNVGTGNISALEFNNLGAMRIYNSGTGNINITGSSNSLELINEGTGIFYGYQFTTTNSEIDISGSGDCQVYSSESLLVNIEGSGDVYYKGDPTINANVSGTGSIINAN